MLDEKGGVVGGAHGDSDVEDGDGSEDGMTEEGRAAKKTKLAADKADKDTASALTATTAAVAPAMKTLKSRPQVYFEVAIGGQRAGRIVMEVKIK